MNHDRKQPLDNFFDAARNEAPLVNDQDLERLLPSEQPSVQGSTNVMSSHSSRILSAFKPSGGFMIAGLGLGAASVVLVTGYLLTSSEPATVNSPTPEVTSAASIVQVSPNASYSELAVAKSDATPSAAKAEAATFAIAAQGAVPAERATPAAPVAVFDSMWQRVQIERIKPVELTQEQVEALGVIQKEDGLVEVYHQTRDGKLAMRMAFPPASPFSEERGAAFVEKASLKGRIAKVMPTMVTDLNGKKLAFFFKSSESLPGVQLEAMNLSQREGDENAPTQIENVTTIQRFSDAQDLDLSDLADLQGLEQFEELKNLPELQELAKQLRVQIQEGGSDGDGKSMRLKISNRNGKPDSIRMDKKGGPRALAFKFDTTGKFSMPEDFEFNMNFDMDSLKNLGMQFQMDAKQMEAGIQKLNKLGLNMKINIDSIQKHVMKYMKNFDMQEFKDFKFDTNMMKNFNFDFNGGDKKDPKRKIKIEKRMRFDSDSIRDGVQVRVDRENLRFNDRGFMMVDMGDQMTKINALVPVQILAKNSTTKYNQNGLLFWYDPKTDAAKEEVLAAIEQKQRPSVAAVESVKIVGGSTVYPNPAIGKTTLQYTLNQPAVISVAVYDLLGKQMFEAAHAQLKGAGEFKQEIDLSTIADGVYLLVLVTDKGEQVTQRLVVGQ